MPWLERNVPEWHSWISEELFCCPLEVMCLIQVSKVLTTFCSFGLIRKTLSALWTSAMLWRMSSWSWTLHTKTTYYNKEWENSSSWGRTANKYYCPVQVRTTLSDHLSDKGKNEFSNLMVPCPCTSFHAMLPCASEAPTCGSGAIIGAAPWVG